MPTQPDDIDYLVFVLSNFSIPRACYRYHSIRNQGLGQSSATSIPSINNDAGEDVDIIRTVLEQEKIDVMTKSIRCIKNYLDEFEVFSEDVDFFKMAYFLCNNLSLSKNNLFKTRHSKISKMAAVITIDNFLAIEIKNRGDSMMKAVPKEYLLKIFSSIYKGKEVEHYGKYGIYHTYRVVSRFAEHLPNQ